MTNKRGERKDAEIFRSSTSAALKVAEIFSVEKISEGHGIVS
ncbi:MAG: hypothetical protein AB8G22_28035 [Saprospiraceae bacterium]